MLACFFHLINKIFTVDLKLQGVGQVGKGSGEVGIDEWQ